MNRFLEFVQHHLYLVSAAILLAIAGIVIELRHHGRSATAIGPADAVRLINSGAAVLDVRAADAFAGGHIIDARHVPQTEIPKQAESLKKYRDKPLLVTCDNGAASATAATALKNLGFTKAVNLRGGIEAWKQENLPLVSGTGGKPKHKGQGVAK
jgi:rhodanese-related sulfurtransferase